MSHLLDTNAWKWLTVGGRLKPAARFLAEENTPLFLLDISLWEISKAVEHKTLDLTMPPLEWMQSALTKNGHHTGDCRPFMPVGGTRIKNGGPGGSTYRRDCHGPPLDPGYPR